MFWTSWWSVIYAASLPQMSNPRKGLGRSSLWKILKETSLGSSEMPVSWKIKTNHRGTDWCRLTECEPMTTKPMWQPALKDNLGTREIPRQAVSGNITVPVTVGLLGVVTGHNYIGEGPHFIRCRWTARKESVWSLHLTSKYKYMCK